MQMSAITDWITALATAVSATAICFLWVQTRLLKEQGRSTQAQLDLLQKEIGDDHERSRREIAINLMLAWTEHLQRETSSARKLAEALTDTECRDLLAEKPLQLRFELKDKIETCLGSAPNTLTVKNDHLCLKESEVALIRWQALRFLNTLEVIMAAWRHNTADRRMLTEQFRYLFDPQKGFTILENLRSAAGGKSVYPAIAEFADHVRKELGQDDPGKGLLGKPRQA
jgi:hypothetical protein